MQLIHTITKKYLRYILKNLNMLIAKYLVINKIGNTLTLSGHLQKWLVLVS